MEQFDCLIKEMAEKEEMIVPNGFDKRVQEALNDLPPKTKKRGPGAVKVALIAAAACLLLAGTALAASPTLRGMLADALGSFAPYAHGQEGETYVIDGIEFKVVSALADDFTVRVYVEARDLEGDRLSKLELNSLGNVIGLVNIPQKDTGGGAATSVSRGMCVAYDEETKTALLAVTSWGQVMADDLSGSVVHLLSLYSFSDNAYQDLWENSEGTALPVEIEPIPSITADMELVLALQAEEVRLSKLGLSIIFAGDGVWPQFSGANVSAKLADGTLVEAPWEGGRGSYGADSAHKVLVWNFREPLDLDEVVGIYINGKYFPVN